MGVGEIGGMRGAEGSSMATVGGGGTGVAGAGLRGLGGTRRRLIQEIKDCCIRREGGGEQWSGGGS